MSKLKQNISFSESISGLIGAGINLCVGIVLFDKLYEITLYTTDYYAWVDQYLIPQQVYQANKYLRRGPMRIIAP